MNNIINEIKVLDYNLLIRRTQKKTIIYNTYYWWKILTFFLFLPKSKSKSRFFCIFFQINRTKFRRTKKK
jgi:hypothetical protein